MSCQVIEHLGCVDEGSDASYPYSFTDKDGVPITLAEKIQYKLSDGRNTLIDWTNITPPTAPGEIDIPGSVNRVQTNGYVDRFLTIFVTHDGGESISKTVRYGIRNSPNITNATP